MNLPKVLKYNLPQLILILLSLGFIYFSIFSDLGAIEKGDVLLLSNGLSSLVYISVWYFILLNKDSLNFDSTNKLYKYFKDGFLISPLTILTIVLGSILFLIGTEFKDFYVIISWFESFIFSFLLVFVLYRFLGFSQNFSLLIFGITLYQTYHNIFINDNLYVYKLILNPFSTWSYVSWFYHSLIYLILIPIKWIGLYFLFKKADLAPKPFREA